MTQDKLKPTDKFVCSYHKVKFFSDNIQAAHHKTVYLSGQTLFW